jgi:hypothetical protein
LSVFWAVKMLSWYYQYEKRCLFFGDNSVTQVLNHFCLNFYLTDRRVELLSKEHVIPIALVSLIFVRFRWELFHWLILSHWKSFFQVVICELKVRIDFWILFCRLEKAIHNFWNWWRLNCWVIQVFYYLLIILNIVRFK